MPVNVDLLRDTFERIEAHPDSWDQGIWAIQRYKDGELCGTAFCFAGWAVQLAGHEVLFDSGYAPTPRGWDAHHALDCATPYGDGEISKVAARELGLDDEQAELLFDSGNTLDYLRLLVDQFIAEAA